jgi:hypothetical protein
MILIFIQFLKGIVRNLHIGHESLVEQQARLSFSFTSHWTGMKNNNRKLISAYIR